MGKKGPPRQLTEAEFSKVLNAVEQDIAYLQITDKVFSETLTKLSTFNRTHERHSKFFNVFITGCQTDFIIRLGRVFDAEANGHSPSCTLDRCIRTMMTSPSFFTEEAIRKRVSPDYLKVATNLMNRHTPQDAEMEQMLATIREERVGLNNLRNKVFAHRDVETMLNGTNGPEFLSSQAEVTKLIGIAHTILNRCTTIWDASTHGGLSGWPAGIDSFFKELRLGGKVRGVLAGRRFHRDVNRYAKPISSKKRPAPQS